MNLILDIIIYILLCILCIFIFILQILFLNHIMYDSYTTFVVGVQFNGNKIKNFINIYDKPCSNSVEFGNYSLIINRSIFKIKRLSKTTLSIKHELSKVRFILTTSDYPTKMSIRILPNHTISISRDLVCLQSMQNYFIISNRFNF
jgi:hypothetical protein